MRYSVVKEKTREGSPTVPSVEPQTRKDPMRSLSITVRMTPRQAVAALRACEEAGLTGVSPRAFAARERVMFGLWDAGWKYDEEGDESWHLGPAAIPDRADR